MRRSIVIALMATGVHVADANDDVNPLLASTAEIVAGGSLELELGWAQRRASESQTNSLQAIARVSLTDRVQLHLGTGNMVSSQDGTTNMLDGVFLGPKVVLFEQSDRVPSIAVSALLSTPTLDDVDAATQTTDLHLMAYASKDLPWVHADVNLGLDVMSVDDHPALHELAALSLSRDISHGVGAMLEGYACWHDGDAGVLTGLTYSIVPRVMLQSGVDVSLYRDTGKATMFAGVVFIPYTPPARHSSSGIAAL